MLLRPGASSSKRQENKRAGRAGRSPKAPQNPQDALWSVIVKQADSFLSTACSCIETPLPCVSTTKTITATNTLSKTCKNHPRHWDEDVLIWDKATSDVIATGTTTSTNTFVVTQVTTSTVYIEASAASQFIPCAPRLFNRESC